MHLFNISIITMMLISLTSCITNKCPEINLKKEAANTTGDNVVVSFSNETTTLLDIINTERANRKLNKLMEIPSLSCAAQNHSNDIGTRKACTHTGRDGSSFVTRVKRCGYNLTSGGEIVACGQTSPRAAVTAWLNSSGHRAIMLDPGQKYFGAGWKNNYWTVVFSKR